MQTTKAHNAAALGWRLAVDGVTKSLKFLRAHPRLSLSSALAGMLLLTPGDHVHFPGPKPRHIARPVSRPDLPLAEPRAAALVMGVNDKAPLYAMDADQTRYPASTTKLMTLYILFEELKAGRIHENTVFTISDYANSKPPSRLVVPGNRITAREAAFALITRSANNIATAVAENIAASSEENFVARMNATAQRLGMKATHYYNPSGLPNGQQNYTSARDLATIAIRLKRDFPDYTEWFNTPVYSFRGARLVNHNHLVAKFEDIVGLKTGYIRASGFNIVNLIEPDKGQPYIVVVMGGRTAAARDAKVIDLACQHIDQFRKDEPAACAGAAKKSLRKRMTALPGTLQNG